MFAAFVDQLLGRMRADEAVKDRKLLLFMDNASIHKGVAVRQAVARHGALVLFNCPYAPDFNPIENYFASLKALVKSHPLRTL